MFYIFKYINVKINWFDIPEYWQFGFQEPATPFMEGVINLHHDLFFFLIVIFVSVAWVLYKIILYYNGKSNLVKDSKYFNPIIHYTNLEFFWTLIPSLILVVVALPTFTLIYSLEDIVNPLLYLKVIGHQWFWVYQIDRPDIEYTTIYPEFFPGSFKNTLFESRMIEASDLSMTDKIFRLLEVDNCLLLPIKTHIRVLITANDVLHSWAIPSLGIKMDACPGRLNQVNVFISREGLYYGQCSEICGVNHAFMPIVIQAVS